MSQKQSNNLFPPPSAQTVKLDDDSKF